jgi:hypothetical protein
LRARRCELQSGQRFWGGSYQSGSSADHIPPYPISSSDPEQCADLCANEVDCKVFVFNNGNCFRCAGQNLDCMMPWALG